MKATGIVRRIDDLGRVVIPKEIRRTMHIHEGAPLEIFTSDEGDVIFRKYSPLGEFPQTSAHCADAINRITRFPVYICDREHVAAAAGPSRKEVLGKKISPELDRIMQNRSGEQGAQQATVAEGQPDKVNVITPILASSDVIGCVAMSVPPETLSYGSGVERKIAEIAAAFLGRHVEE